MHSKYHFVLNDKHVLHDIQHVYNAGDQCIFALEHEHIEHSHGKRKRRPVYKSREEDVGKEAAELDLRVG